MSEHTLSFYRQNRVRSHRIVWAILPLILLAGVIALFLAGGAGLTIAGRSAAT